MFSPGRHYGTVGSRSHYYRAQDGDKEYLLCMDCEQHLGRAENYLSVICRGQRREMESRGLQIEAGGRLHGVDAGLVTRALLGIALKAHFAQAGQFLAFQFEPEYLEDLRMRILSDEYPPRYYDTHAIKWMDLRGSGILPRDGTAISLGESEGDFSVFIELGGVLFVQLLQPSTRQLNVLSSAPDGILRQGFPWWLMVSDVTLNKRLPRRLVRRFDGRPVPGGPLVVPPEAPCPCGLLPRRKHSECCFLVWYHLPRWPVVLATSGHQCEVGEGRMPCRLVLEPPPALIGSR